MKTRLSHLGVAGIRGLVLLTAIHPAQAADDSAAPTATISGRVLNEVTGRYLNNARVTAREVNTQVMTDETGTYRLTNVPAGTITLDVLYTGLEEQRIPLSVAPGQSIVRDVNLAPRGSGPIRIDPFVVEINKQMDQSTIAINEQRFAPNIKTVVATGDLSEQAGGSIAEFLKFVPGIASDDNRSGGSSVSVRGFPADQTVVTLDGAATSNASTSPDVRNLGTRMTMSLPSVARVEVTKVPTPSTGADTMAGSINLVSRNAFESARREFRYTATIAGEHTQIADAIAGRKVYSLWSDKRIIYAAPSANFTFVHPVNKNFGYTVSGMYDYSRPTSLNRIYTHNLNSPTFGSSPSAPMWSTNLNILAGQIGNRSQLGTTADWRVTPKSILSAGLQYYDSVNYNGDYRIAFNTGTNATPTVAGGVAGSFGPDFTIGATGRGSVTYSHNTQVQLYDGVRANLRYGIELGDWKVDLKAARSISNFEYRTIPSHGYIRSLSASSNVPLRVELRDIDPESGPGRHLVFDNNNRPVDLSNPAFFNGVAVNSASTLYRDNTDLVTDLNVDIRRTLRLRSNPVVVRAGGRRKTQERDRWNEYSSTYTYNGPNGNQSPVPFLTPALDVPGAGPQSLVSPYIGAEAWNKNPSLFTQTPAQIVATEVSRRQNSEVIAETAEALYVQVEAQFFRHRLNVLTGVRYERTAGEGVGSLNTPDGVWRRSPDGTFVVGANGARVRKPEAGAAGSMQEVNFIWHERGARSTRTYDGHYPSLHLTYNVTERIQTRAAYARTFGRPNFTFIIPRTVITESTNAAGDVIGGRLTVRNPGLLPWTADNYDLTTEHYSDLGGVFSVNVFRKDVVDFFGSETRDATALELREAGVTPEAGESWQLVTTNNVGSARIDGLELSANQSLRMLDPWLGGWGGSFRVFANFTKIRDSANNKSSFKTRRKKR